ncbi:MAG: hypothetical protein V4582_15425 [Pseudomonadota bacterium]
MNIIKNMEAIFVVTVALIGSATYIVDAIPEARASVVMANADTAMEAPATVITVTAKRMSAAEKQQSLDAERQADASASAGRSI